MSKICLLTGLDGETALKKMCINCVYSKYIDETDKYTCDNEKVMEMGYEKVSSKAKELGFDFIEKFDSPSKFCKWCNLVPNNRISGGKLISSRVPKRKNPVGQVFRQCANATRDMKNSMGFYFRRLKSRGGHMSAIVATAHKIAEIFYVMVKNKIEYNENKVGLSEEELLRRKIERAQRTLNILNEKLYGTAV